MEPDGDDSGVPSVHTYANRAGIFDCRSPSTRDAAEFKTALFTGIIPPVAGLGKRSEIRNVVRNSVDSAPVPAKGQERGSSESHNLAAILRIRWRLVQMPIRGACVGLSGFCSSPTFSSTSFAQNPTAPPYDLAIIDAHIMDGSGSPWYQGAVGHQKDGKIAAIGRIAKCQPSGQSTPKAWLFPLDSSTSQPLRFRLAGRRQSRKQDPPG